MDFPRAWEIARSVPIAEHSPACSYAQSSGGLLCDCAVLTEHPEYNEPSSAVAVVEPVHDEGRYVQEQEAVAAEAAHLADIEDFDEPGSEVEVLGSTVADPPGRDPGNDPPIDPLDIPDEYDLPMCGSILACPKCSGNQVKVEYHSVGVNSEPCGKTFGWPQVQNLGEHLCKTCIRCKYGWPERVFSGS